MPWRYLIEGPWIVFIAYWAVGALKTRRTTRTETFASRYGILFLEIVGFVLLFRDDAAIGFLRNRVITRTYATGRYWRGSHLGWHCARAVGALASGAILERAHHDQRRSQADPHRAVCAVSASHLFWTGSCGHWLSAGDRPLAMRDRSLPDYSGLLDQSEKRRRHSKQHSSEHDFREHCRQTGFLLPRVRAT